MIIVLILVCAPVKMKHDSTACTTWNILHLIWLKGHLFLNWKMKYAESFNNSKNKFKYLNWSVSCEEGEHHVIAWVACVFQQSTTLVIETWNKDVPFSIYCVLSLYSVVDADMSFLDFVKRKVEKNG